MNVETVGLINQLIRHPVSFMMGATFCGGLFRPPGPASAGRRGLYILLLYLLFLQELIDESRNIRRPPILYQQWAPCTTPKISIDIRPMLPPFFTGGQHVENFGPNFDTSRLRTAVFLNTGALSENKNKLVKDR